MKRVHRKDYSWEPLALPTKNGSGFMRVEGFFTGSGVFPYTQEDGSVVREWRPPSEVEDATSIDSLKLVPVTIDHPDEEVTIDNIDTLSVGTVGDMITTEYVYSEQKDDDGNRPPPNVRLRGRAMLTDPAAIKIIEDKKLREVSCGYFADLEMTSGVTPDGLPYDAIQRRIVYNHLAIGVNGRQGPNIALRVDHKPEAPAKEKPVKKIIIDGVTYEGNEQLAEVVEQLQRKQGAALAEAQSKTDAKDKEIATLQANVGDAEARADAATSTAKAKEKELELLNSKVKEGVRSRKKLERTAESIMGSEAFKTAGLEDLDDDDVKIAVIKHVAPERDLSDKVAAAKKGDLVASSYLAAAYDLTVESAMAAGEGAGEGEGEGARADANDAGPARRNSARGDSTNFNDARAAHIAAKNKAYQKK